MSTQCLLTHSCRHLFCNYNICKITIANHRHLLPCLCAQAPATRSHPDPYKFNPQPRLILHKNQINFFLRNTPAFRVITYLQLVQKNTRLSCSTCPLNSSHIKRNDATVHVTAPVYPRRRELLRARQCKLLKLSHYTPRRRLWGEEI
jgi:hypothetical protein